MSDMYSFQDCSFEAMGFLLKNFSITVEELVSGGGSVVGNSVVIGSVWCDVIYIFFARLFMLTNTDMELAHRVANVLMCEIFTRNRGNSISGVPKIRGGLFLANRSPNVNVF